MRSPEAILATAPLVAGIDEREIAALAALSEPFTLDAGERLFAEGDRPDAVYVIDEGRVELRKRLPGERSMTATEVGAGTVFGEMGVIAGLPRPFSVHALDATTGVRLDAAAVEGLVAAPRPGARELAKRLGASAVATLRELVERLATAVDEDDRAAAPPHYPGQPGPGTAIEVAPEPEELAYLETLVFLGDFDAPQLARLLGDLRRLSAPRGTELVAEGDRPDALLLVLRGAVESTVRRGGTAGRVRLSGPGRCVTHLGVLDAGPSPVSCHARERCVVLELPKARLEALAGSEHLLDRRFLWGIYRDVVEAVGQADRPLALMAAARPHG